MRITGEARKRILQEELKQLKEEVYISKDTYTEIIDAYDLYYERKLEVEALVKAEQAAIEGKEEAVVKQAVVPKERMKKVLSSQEVRDRNITWALNLGIILLLIGGLVLATSAWDILGSWMKTGLIGLIALLFFGLAHFTSRVLKIEKTAYAFYILGSLFLPITIVAAGFFGIFGTYLSFFGDGKYLFGAIGSLLVLPVYIILSMRLSSRLFIWFSYITISIFASLLIAALYLPVDGFYLCIMLFNVVLIFMYRYLRADDRFKLFMKEFVSYIQANLILSTVLMLLFYNHELMHSVNLILTAILYFAMIYVTNHKNYHFVFSVMLVYGAYQLIESSALYGTGSIAYALLGFVFIVIPMFKQGELALQKAFRYTSAVVSALAFLYITLEGILLRMNDPSLTLMIAYIIIFSNFTYLTTVTEKRLFKYLSPVFFMVALYEGVLISQSIIGYKSLSFAMFMMSLITYLVIGYFLKLNFFQYIKESMRDVTSLVMLLCILMASIFTESWQVGTMLLLISILAVYLRQLETREWFAVNNIPARLHALSLGLAIIMYVYATLNNGIYGSILTAESVIISGIIVFIASITWKYFKQNLFYNSTFFTSQIFYSLGILLTFVDEFNMILRVVIIFGGIIMAYLLYRKTKWKVTPYLVSGLTLLAYLNVLFAVEQRLYISFDLYHIVQFIVGAVLLLTIGSIMGKRDSPLRNAFWSVGHVYLPFALLYSLILYKETAFPVFIIATALYGVSVYKSKLEVKIKSFLYAAFTSLWFVISLLMIRLELEAELHYSFLIMSVVGGVLWYISKNAWPKRIAYYITIFSVIGITAFINAQEPFIFSVLIVTVAYVTGLLYMLHKERWGLFTVIPLLLLYYGLTMFSLLEAASYSLLYFASFGIILTITGYLIYPLLYEKSEEKRRFEYIDWYAIIGFIVFFSLYTFTGASLWSKLLPGILIALYLLIQRKRIPSIQAKWIVFIASAYVFQPYYAFLGHFEIPTLFVGKLYILPWIIPVIMLKKVSDKQQQAIAHKIQWAGLVIIALLLVQDGLASNTIYDALIIGGLSLASVLGGMVYQMKSFFFVGSSVLLLNVFLQTRPYWGNLPWWAYLLIAGSILIGAASYNEWHKQKVSDGKETFVSMFNKKIIQKIKDWE